MHLFELRVFSTHISYIYIYIHTYLANDPKDSDSGIERQRSTGFLDQEFRQDTAYIVHFPSMMTGASCSEDSEGEECLERLRAEVIWRLLYPHIWLLG